MQVEEDSISGARLRDEMDLEPVGEPGTDGSRDFEELYAVLHDTRLAALLVKSSSCHSSAVSSLHLLW